MGFFSLVALVDDLAAAHAEILITPGGSHADG
jgi:hypothetical protein